MRPIVAAVLAAVVCGCQPQPGGGGFSADGCAFEDIPGTATIVAVVDVPPEAVPLDCPDDPVQVVFDFIADDAEAAGELATRENLVLSRNSTWGETDFFVPRTWADEEGLVAGSEHPCNLRIGEGFCPDPFGVLTEVDYDEAEAQCAAGAG